MSPERLQIMRSYDGLRRSTLGWLDGGLGRKPENQALFLDDRESRYRMNTANESP